MIFSLRAREEFADVVVTEALAQSERPRFRAIWLGGRRREDFIKANTQRGVDYFFERFAQLGRAFPRFGGNVRIERQCGSHAGIMTPDLKKSTHVFK